MGTMSSGTNTALKSVADSEGMIQIKQQSGAEHSEGVFLSLNPIVLNSASAPDAEDSSCSYATNTRRQSTQFSDTPARAAPPLHRRQHSANTDSPKTGKEPLHCKQCGKTLSQYPVLEAHERVYTGEKTYMCEACGRGRKSQHAPKVSRRREAVRLHIVWEEVRDLESHEHPCSPSDTCLEAWSHQTNTSGENHIRMQTHLTSGAIRPFRPHL
uniref:C2H2-type domain-containing protein n=1 Tax=Hucho hucho TaxID=62062 RepID=A0A4W5Q4Z7_9TELE